MPRPNFNPFTPAPKVQEISVRYIKETPQTRLLAKSAAAGGQKLLPVSEPFLKLDSAVVSGAKRPPAYIDQQEGGPKAVPNSQNPRPAGFSRPAFANSEVMAIKRKITLPAIEMAKIDNPSYISYYQIVREKIRRNAYQNYTHNETGDVYVSFIISNDGYIKEVKIIEEKTTVNDYLKHVALRSIRDASPFPNFPKELDYPQLSFNIIISFEIE